MNPVIPDGHWLLGHYPQFKNNPIEFLLNTAKENGDFQLFKLLNKKIYFVNGPDAVKHVMQTNYKNYEKSPGYRQLRYLGGMGIFTSDGEKWLHQRKLYQPAFTHEAIKSYFDLVQQLSSEMAEEWMEKVKKGTSINASQDMMKITMSIITASMFSQKIDYNSEIWQALTTSLEWINHRSLRNPFILPANWPTKANKKFWKAKNTLDQLIFEVIAKREQGDDFDDLLHRFMHPPKGLKPFNREELRDELMTIFIAGHETSANVLMWTYYCLLQHREVLDKVYAELNELPAPMSYENLRNLPYLTNVLQEVMRLYPPVWHIGRMNLEDDELYGHSIPKGSHVRIIPLTLHRNTKLWDNPEAFKPERFENNSEDLTYSFIPFGAGPRLCAGRNFAMMEMLVILFNSLKAIDLRALNTPKNEVAPLMTLRPKMDVVMSC